MPTGRTMNATQWLRRAVLLSAGVLLLADADPAGAQGCFCARQTQPGLYGSGGPYLHRGEWQLGLSYRFNHCSRMFAGSSTTKVGEKMEREQHLIDLFGTYAVSDRAAVTLLVPFADLTVGMGGGSDTARTSGLGDVQLVGRYWLLDVAAHPDANVSLGLGVKFPTGNHDARDAFMNEGGVRAVRFLDISTQPGDGGTGVVLDVQAFRRFKGFTGFIGGTYLVNPRETNGTPSLLVGMMGADAPRRARVNSVPDQFVGRVGVAVPVRAIPGLSFSLAGRVEGVPTSDLVGGSEGFRFAGHAVFIEPGVAYSRGRDVWSLSVPVRVAARINNIPTTPGRDTGTVVPFSVIFGYTHKFGR